jgi:FKBP-type peptidyl-prolyl cis-trans isomerase
VTRLPCVVIAAVVALAAAGVSRADPPADVAAPAAGARHLPSGVALRTLAPGHGRARPGAQDCVRVRYAGWRRDGTAVASTPSGGPPELQCLAHVIPGVAEALRSMTVGERRRVWVPARLIVPDAPLRGRVRQDDDERSPARQELTYDVELVEIIAAPSPPPDLRAPPRGARRTPSGVSVQTVRRGASSIHPLPGSQVTVHLAGWRSDRTLVESTAMGGHAAVFQVGDLLPGLRDGVLTMAVGERARIWIPAPRAYGEHPRRRSQPAGPLVYEVELLAVR